MKLIRFLLFIFLSLLQVNIHAQIKNCGTPEPQFPLYVDSALLQQRVLYTSPLLMKIFVYVVANNDGSSRAVSDTAVFRQLEYMRQFYAPHNICFILAGIEQLNSTDLNDMDASEQVELTSFLDPDMLNVFIHSDLDDGSQSLLGTAYNIPNYYFSLHANAITSINNRGTPSHEAGHCFGLYHTFAKVNAAEKILRGTIPTECVNCMVAGDLLCDTEADPHSDSYDTGNVIDTDCNYYGLEEQTCNGVTRRYNMDPHNIMSYGRRSCHNIFTNGQGARARDFITTNGYLTPCIAPDNDNISASQTISSGRDFFLARNSITISASAFTVNNSARVNIASSNSVVIKPGTSFTPSTTNAYVSVRASGLCQ